MAQKQEALALLVFIGGLSAATGMVIVETIALSTMVCNDLVMPVLLRWKCAAPDRARRPHRRCCSASGAARSSRSCCWAISTSSSRAKPTRWCRSASSRSPRWRSSRRPCIGGIFWKGGTRRGALAGLIAGLRGLALHAAAAGVRASPGWLPIGFLEHGPVRHRAAASRSQLFGLAGLDQITHAMIWSMLANIGAYVGVSLARPPERRRAQPGDALRRRVHADAGERGARFWRGTASVPELCRRCSARFLGPARAHELFRAYAARARPRIGRRALEADAELVHFAEMQLAGAIGAASARMMVASVVQEEPLGIDEVHDDPRRGLAGDRLQPPARAEVARARGGDRRAARGQRAPAGARPPEGRLRLDRHARAAHAAHLDPRVLRDPARQPAASSSTQRAALPRHHHQGVRAPHAPHQPGARPRQARVGQRRMARSASSTCARSSTTPSAGTSQLFEERDVSARDAASPDARAAGARRSRPPDAGDAEPAVERGEVLRAGATAAVEIARRREQAGSAARRRARQRPRHRAGATRKSSSRSSARSATRSPSKPQGTRPRARPSAARSSSTSAAACGSRARPGRAPASPSPCRHDTILIADDEPNIVTALEFLLRGRGYEVEVARNGDGGARAASREARPDLVLLDVMMPRAQRLRRVPRDPLAARARAHQGGHAVREGPPGRGRQGHRGRRRPLRHQAFLQSRAPGQDRASSWRVRIALPRRDGRAAEGARLESVYTLIAYRGFESLSLRQTIYRQCRRATKSALRSTHDRAARLIDSS